MKFYEKPPKPPESQSLVSEDGNWTLEVQHLGGKVGTRFSLLAERSPILGAYGQGRTKIAAMNNCRKTILDSITFYQDRLQQLDAMIEEEEKNIPEEVPHE